MDPAEPTLPFDVISEVIDQMDSDTDGLTLRTLSTTCRALLKPSQRKLFNSLKILVTEPYNDAQQPRYFALNDLFNTSPPLAAYIRRLNVAFAVPFPATVPILVSILERLGSTTSLRIDNGVWPAEHTKQVPPWRNCLNAVLRYPSLRRLELQGYGELPALFLQLPALTTVNLGAWRIEGVGVDDPRPNLTKHLDMCWFTEEVSPGILRTFLRISPLLTHLTVTRSQIDSSPFKGLSKAIIDSTPTLSTLETITFRMSWTTPFTGISEELVQLSLSDGNVLEKIRINLYCCRLLQKVFLGYFKGFDQDIEWTRFRHLRELEVNIYSKVGVPDEPQRRKFIRDNETGIRDSFTGFRNRGGDEVIVKVFTHPIIPDD